MEMTFQDLHDIQPLNTALEALEHFQILKKRLKTDLKF